MTQSPAGSGKTCAKAAQDAETAKGATGTMIRAPAGATGAKDEAYAVDMACEPATQIKASVSLAAKLPTTCNSTGVHGPRIWNPFTLESPPKIS